MYLSFSLHTVYRFATSRGPWPLYTRSHASSHWKIPAHWFNAANASTREFHSIRTSSQSPRSVFLACMPLWTIKHYKNIKIKNSWVIEWMRCQLFVHVLIHSEDLYSSSVSYLFRGACSLILTIKSSFKVCRLFLFSLQNFFCATFHLNSS